MGFDASAHHWNQARQGLLELFPSQLTVAFSVADVADTPVGRVDAPAHAASSSERLATVASLARLFVGPEPITAILLSPGERVDTTAARRQARLLIRPLPSQR